MQSLLALARLIDAINDRLGVQLASHDVIRRGTRTNDAQPTPVTLSAPTRSISTARVEAAPPQRA